MKNKTLVLATLSLVISLFIISCKEKQISYVKMTMELNGPIQNLTDKDPIPNSIAEIISYYDSTCIEKLFVPNVTFIRTDFVVPKTLEFELPLSAENKFRKSLGFLSAENLQEDYDKNLKSSSIPLILIQKTDRVDNSALDKSIKKTDLNLNISDNNNDSVAVIKKRIQKILCDNDENTVIIVRINTVLDENELTEDQNKLIADADILFAKKKYLEAKTIYTKVINAVPLNNYVKTQLSRIEKILLTSTTTTVTDKTTKTTTTSETQITNSGNTKSNKGTKSGSGIKSLNLSYARYTGDVKNGKMNGDGTLEFLEDFQIPTVDSEKKRFANKGDKVQGTWIDGKLQQGKRYDKNNKQVETIYL